MKNEIKKIKYHQQLLLHIAIAADPEDVRFFQNVIAFDLAEEQVKTLLTLLSQEDGPGLSDFLEHQHLGYPYVNFLLDCVAQSLYPEHAKQLLSKK